MMGADFKKWHFFADILLTGLPSVRFYLAVIVVQLSCVFFEMLLMILFLTFMWLINPLLVMLS